MGAAFVGEIDLALELRERAARLIDSLEDEALASRVDALSSLATAELYLDLHVEASRHGERGLALARSTEQTQLLPILTPILGTSLSMSGRMERSAEVLDDAIEAARLVDNTQAMSLNLFNRRGERRAGTARRQRRDHGVCRRHQRAGAARGR